nr:unnamed protein product [Callosobruchus analis]
MTNLKEDVPFTASLTQVGIHILDAGSSIDEICVVACVAVISVVDDVGVTTNASLDALDRQNKSYSFAWVNGVSVRSIFTQTILDHEKSQQHISASLSYNNWLQGNTIDTLLKSEIDSKITLWRDVVHRIINYVVIYL